MCKFIGKSNVRILCKLSKSEILRLYSIVHVAMETKKTSHFTCQWKSFISIFFTCQVSACELQPFSCHDFANDIYSQTAKTVFSHLKSNKFQDLLERCRKFRILIAQCWTFRSCSQDLATERVNIASIYFYHNNLTQRMNKSRLQFPLQKHWCVSLVQR